MAWWRTDIVSVTTVAVQELDDPRIGVKVTIKMLNEAIDQKERGVCMLFAGQGFQLFSDFFLHITSRCEGHMTRAEPLMLQARAKLEQLRRHEKHIEADGSMIGTGFLELKDFQCYMCKAYSNEQRTVNSIAAEFDAARARLAEARAVYTPDVLDHMRHEDEIKQRQGKNIGIQHDESPSGRLAFQTH
jgi:hypothetical protein